MNYANRGMNLEKTIIAANDFYEKNEVAYVKKIPTNVKIMRRTVRGIHGFLERGDWVDFSGVYMGRSVIFDAKQSNLKSFPLQNVHDNQIKTLKEFDKHGGYSFLIVHMKDIDTYFYLNYRSLEIFYERSKNGGRKSISIKEFMEYCPVIKFEDGILDYISVMENV